MNFQVILYFLITVISAMAFSLVPPLFPKLFNSRKLTEELLGQVIGTSAISNLISTPFIPTLIKYIGRKNLLFISIFTEATCSLSYGIVEKIPSTTLLVIILFILRAVHGIGGSIICIISYSAVSNIKEPKNVKSYLGYLELAWSLGIAVGPLIVSLFGRFGGFSLPFIIAGISEYSSCCYYLKKLDEELLKDDSDDENKDTPSFFEVIFNWKIFILALSASCGEFATTFYFPSLTNHLSFQYKLPLSISSLFFTNEIITYLFAILLVEKVSNTLGLYFTISLGNLFSSIGSLFIFPVKPFPLKIAFTIGGLLIVGLSSIPCCLLVLIALEDEIKKVYPNLDGGSANDLASAIFTLFINIGDLTGPPLGGFFSHRFGFMYSCLYIAIIIFAYSIINAVSNYSDIYQNIVNIGKKKDSDNNEEKELMMIEDKENNSTTESSEKTLKKIDIQEEINDK